VLSQNQPRLAPKQSLEVLPDRTPTVNRTSGDLNCAQQNLKLVDSSRLDRKQQEKSSKQVQPLKAVPSHKIVAAAKAALEEDRNGRRDSSEENEKCRKSRPIVSNKTQCAVGEESADQGNNNIFL
jgi:hypothetical protein